MGILYVKKTFAFSSQKVSKGERGVGSGAGQVTWGMG